MAALSSQVNAENISTSGSMADQSEIASAGSTMNVKPGAADYTEYLKELFADAPSGATVRFMPGDYPVATGTVYILTKPVNIVGSHSTLLNVRILALANLEIDGVDFTEKDCKYDSANVAACPVSTPIIAIGGIGYPITKAVVKNVNLNFTRAYTGIALGYGPTTNVSVTNFSISDSQLSGITILGGSDIHISHGSIQGGKGRNVDDGIALYAATGELGNVFIDDVKTDDTFDAVGIGTLMYYPIHDVTIKNTKCRETAVCIYVKAGDSEPAPRQFAGYSSLKRLTVAGVSDEDPTGSRYLSAVWVYAKGGATVSDIAISNVTGVGRSASAKTPHIWLFTDAKSKITNARFQTLSFKNAGNVLGHSADVSGFPIGEGVFVEDLGVNDISDVEFAGLTLYGTSYYAIDSSLARVHGLSISDLNLQDVNMADPKLPATLIPFEYSFDGQMISE